MIRKKKLKKNVRKYEKLIKFSLRRMPDIPMMSTIRSTDCPIMGNEVFGVKRLGVPKVHLTGWHFGAKHQTSKSTSARNAKNQ